ncbi:MAG: prolyl oligopeptidase family serine peptidase [Candidatus Neomarinimicrobiota bacterium]
MRYYKIITLLILNVSLVGEGIKNKSSEKFITNLAMQVSLKYHIYFPNNYHDSDTKFPLVLFLHGAGERGDDLRLVEKHGIPKMINNGINFPFITVAPQCPKFQYWSEPVNVKTLLLLVEEIIKKNKVDIERIYATGLSMGGYGTLAIAKERPDLFSAIIPVCGGLDTTDIERLKDIPIWLFHGAEDKVVPVENSELIYDLLKPINPEIKITIYKGINHNSWEMTYNNQNIYDWMLKYKK